MGSALFVCETQTTPAQKAVYRVQLASLSSDRATQLANCFAPLTHCQSGNRARSQQLFHYSDAYQLSYAKNWKLLAPASTPESQPAFVFIGQQTLIFIRAKQTVRRGVPV